MKARPCVLFRDRTPSLIRFFSVLVWLAFVYVMMGIEYWLVVGDRGTASMFQMLVFFGIAAVVATLVVRWAERVFWL